MHTSQTCPSTHTPHAHIWKAQNSSPEVDLSGEQAHKTKRLLLVWGILFFSLQVQNLHTGACPQAAPEGPSMSAAPEAPDPAREAYNLNFLFLKPQFLVASTRSGPQASENDCVCQLLSHMPFSLAPARGVAELLLEQMNVTVTERLASLVMPPKAHHNHPEVELSPATVN